MEYKAIKIETEGNMRYIFPEEVVDLFEAGIISSNQQEFVADIVKDAETVKPVEFDRFKGSFDVVAKNKQEKLQNIKTELSDKMIALMSLYGRKFAGISNSEIREILNDVLTMSSVKFVYNTKTEHNLGKLSENGMVSPNFITLGSSVEQKEKN